MKKIWIESKKIILLISIFIMLSMDVCIAEEADTIEKAKIKGIAIKEHDYILKN